MKKQTITIIGGGSSTHTLIPFLTDKLRNIYLLTSQPEKWNQSVVLELRNSDDKALLRFV